MSKTRKVMVGVSSTALMLGLTGCGSEAQELPPIPEDLSCSDWEWDYDDGVWECDDYDSQYYGHFYYGGRYYSSKSNLYKSKDYNAYKNSSSFIGGVTKSSGFGSGSKSFGG